MMHAASACVSVDIERYIMCKAYNNTPTLHLVTGRDEVKKPERLGGHSAHLSSTSQALRTPVKCEWTNRRCVAHDEDSEQDEGIRVAISVWLPTMWRVHACPLHTRLEAHEYGMVWHAHAQARGHDYDMVWYAHDQASGPCP